MSSTAYQEITNQIKVLKETVESTEGKAAGVSLWGTRSRIDGYANKVSYLKREFDDELVRSLLERIAVVSEDKIEIQFRSGIVMTQRIDYYD